MKQHNIILSGGGTGGHIFPAIAIANELKKMRPETEILFIGAKGRMEMEKVPSAGYKIIGLDISGISRKNLMKNISLPLKLIRSINEAKKIISEFNPSVIIGVGGYASGPALWAGIRKRIPTLIQEQNSFPGITNKILSRFVNIICVGYPGMDKFFPAKKIILTGNPVRQSISGLKDKRVQALEYFKYNDSGFTLLVTGGSLGARAINESIFNLLDMFNSHSIRLIWQTGSHYYPIAKETEKKNSGIRVFEFIKEMDLAYAAADAVVSRAGAISVSELCMAAKPVILIPSPNVTEDHQTKNAKVLADKKAAIIINDNHVMTSLGDAVLKLYSNPELCSQMSKNIASFAIQDSAKKIAKEIFNLSEAA